MTRLTDDWPCPPDDAANALTTLARCPWLADWRYDADAGRVRWELRHEERDGADAAHNAIKTRVQRSISEHAAVGWE